MCVGERERERERERARKRDNVCESEIAREREIPGAPTCGGRPPARNRRAWLRASPDLYDFGFLRLSLCLLFSFIICLSIYFLGFHFILWFEFDVFGLESCGLSRVFAGVGFGGLPQRAAGRALSTPPPGPRPRLPPPPPTPV